MVNMDRLSICSSSSGKGSDEDDAKDDDENSDVDGFLNRVSK